ncbi:MAG TPA: carboxypeptidase-like regulatory domain-containing protein [Flavobacteriaceae bacterium]|nr:carboxypeptidase-like regulatory domain-containing protein [Flavobacteriaceae bacterium]
MNTNLKSFLTLLVSFLGLTAFSQIELKNKVLDSVAMYPLEYTSVYVQGTTIGTVTNSDGKFALSVPEKNATDTLIISSIGYKSYKIPVNQFDNNVEVLLLEDVASLDEVILVADTRPKTGNDIMLRVIERLPFNMPEAPYLQKGFLRHKERNRKEFKWLIESALTLYDSGYASNSAEHLKINVDEVRKSYDLREIDSLLIYTSYLKNRMRNFNIKTQNLKRDTIKTSSLVKAIKWNDTKINGLEGLFQGKLNLVRNSGNPKALFGKDMLGNHQFKLDTVLVDNDRKLYKIKIEEGPDYVNLNTPGVYNDGFKATGWIYVYWDNYAIKKIEYELQAASPAQKSRSKTLFDTNVVHKMEISYMEYQDKMYLNYMYYETPKLVNVGDKTIKPEEVTKEDRDARFYYTVQEVLFTEVILEPEAVQAASNKTWDPDIFTQRPYNKSFWRDYNTLLENEEEEKLILDLTHRFSLYKE